MLASTVSPDDMAPPKLFRSTNGGSSWTQVPGLPAKAAMDISFDPQNSQTVYVVFLALDMVLMYTNPPMLGVAGKYRQRIAGCSHQLYYYKPKTK